MKDKEKQIEEMAKDIEHCCNRYDKEDRFVGNKCSSCEYWCDTNNLCCSFGNKEATYLYEHGYRKLLKDSVVLSREEYERLSSSHDIVFCDNKDCPDNLLCRCAEISECPKNIPKYNEKLSANKHKLELFQKLGKERERADSWEDRYKLVEQELKQSSKETAEKIFQEINHLIVKDRTTPIWIKEKLIELAKSLGVEIKE